jgi:ADP-heptose:LPS heptosyltransferase
MLRRTLPNLDKTIKLKINVNDINNVLENLKDKNKDKPGIVIHPGKWWQSKTFPVKWWQEIIDKLSEKLTVYIIGKTIDEKQGYLDVKCPNNGYDFRDITSLGEMIALISHTKCTLSNDSSPIHIAGAFDNWIVVIPTAKHPDHILPYRNGSQSYKSKALYKKLLIDDLETKYTEFYTDTIDTLPIGKNIEDYLPDVKDVVSEIFNIYELK